MDVLRGQMGSVVVFGGHDEEEEGAEMFHLPGRMRSWVSNSYFIPDEEDEDEGL